MCLNKEKIGAEMIFKWVKKVFNSVILVIFLLTVVVPVVMNAKTGQTSLDFSQELAKDDQQDRQIELVWRESRGIGSKLARLSQKQAPNVVVRAVITAYTSTPDQTDNSPFIAASGKYVYDGMIAANWLPFGTKVKIPSVYGDKMFTVDDRMNPRYGHGRMDIWLDAPRSEAIKFGVKVVDVEVYYQAVQLTYNK